MRGSQVTIKDIARELKISPSTVSRALKNHPDISERTKVAVNKLAKKYGYKPNPIALSLLQSKSNIIGVIIPEIVHFFFSSVISGIEDVAFKAGYHVMICQSNESYEREIEAIQALSASRIDGLLISVSKNTYQFEHLKELENIGIPVVFFDRVCEDIETHKVVIDDFHGAFQAVEHLISIGRKRIAHLSGPQNLLIGKKRLEGYLEALKKHNLPIDNELIINCDTFEDALKCTPSLLKMNNRPDAIFAVNDLTAAGSMRIARQYGLNIPDEIAFVGFTNERISRLTEPTLTSIEQHGFEMGQEAMQLLIKRFSTNLEDFKAETKVIKSSLVIRESTK